MSACGSTRRRRGRSHTWLAAAVLMALTSAAHAELPRPLGLDDAARLAREGRLEVTAARERALAARQRPAMVGGLEDPMLMPRVEAPFMLDSVETGLSFAQELPLSPVLARRERAARAEARALAHEAEDGALAVVHEALLAFHMLWGRREEGHILERQSALARQLVAAATARYGAGNGSQSDVLRAEAELARLEAARRAQTSGIAAAEVMLAVSLGADPATPIPELAAPAPSELGALAAPEGDAAAVAELPTLEAGAAEVSRWRYEVSVMRAMYAPMARIETGPVYSSEMGAGWMLMFGVSLPIWSGKLDAGVAEARAMVRMAEADRDAMQRMAAGELAQARHLVAAAYAAYQGLADEVEPRAKAAVDAALAAYGSGQSAQVTVLEAMQAYWSVERELAMARMELGLARARFDRALGRWRQPEEKTP